MGRGVAPPLQNRPAECSFAILNRFRHRSPKQGKHNETARGGSYDIKVHIALLGSLNLRAKRRVIDSWRFLSFRSGCRGRRFTGRSCRRRDWDQFRTRAIEAVPKRSDNHQHDDRADDPQRHIRRRGACIIVEAGPSR
jgi:hypothetical protein